VKLWVCLWCNHTWGTAQLNTVHYHLPARACDLWPPFLIYRSCAPVPIHQAHDLTTRYSDVLIMRYAGTKLGKQAKHLDSPAFHLPRAQVFD
jgi:hypothetical protein